MAAWSFDAHPMLSYDTLYHSVWSPKYRRDVLQGEVQQRVWELFAGIAEQYDITIEEMEVSPDRVHIVCSFPPLVLHRTSRDTVQEFECPGHLSCVPTREASPVGRGTLGRWLFCP